MLKNLLSKCNKVRIYMFNAICWIKCRPRFRKKKEMWKVLKNKIKTFNVWFCLLWKLWNTVFIGPACFIVKEIEKCFHFLWFKLIVFWTFFSFKLKKNVFRCSRKRFDQIIKITWHYLFFQETSEIKYLYNHLFILQISPWKLQVTTFT